MTTSSRRVRELQYGIGPHRAGRHRMPYQPIENYGVIGNMRTAAMVGLDGSLDSLGVVR